MIKKSLIACLLLALAGCGESGRARLALPRQEERHSDVYLLLTTKEPLVYSLPLWGFDDHVEMVITANRTRQLHFYEAQNEADARVRIGEYFVATDTANGYTHVVEYSGIDRQRNELWLWDMAKTTTDQVPYDPATSTASYPVAGIPRRIVIDPLTDALAIDQDGSRVMDGKQSRLVSIDGTVTSQEDLRPK